MYRILDTYQAAIDALCPAPSQWPNGASFCYLNATGFPLFEFQTPEARAKWLAANIAYEPIHIPPGLDWRACNWSMARAEHLHKP